jgi:SSS family solute:Na+ symporter
MNSLEIAVVAAYLVVIFDIAFAAKKKETTSEFLIANRSVGTVLTTASISAVIGGLFLGSVAALGFEMGLGALWLVAGFATGLGLLGLVAGRIKAVADEANFLTFSDYLFTKFDAKTGYLGTAILYAVYFLLLAAQFIVGGQLLASHFQLSYPLAVIGMGIATLAYLLLGGFKAVIRTDLLQFAVMLLVFVCLVPLNLDVGNLEFDSSDFAKPGLLGIASLFLSGVAGIFMGAEVWQRLYSARSARVACNSSLVSAVVWLIFGVCLVLLGIAASANPEVAPDRALYYGLFEVLPSQMIGVATAALLAALMSTIDTEVFLLASSIGKDLVARRRKLSQDSLARVVRAAMLGVCIPAMAIAIYWPSILDIFWVNSSLFAVLFPATSVSLFVPLNRHVVFVSIVGGSLSLLVLLFFDMFNPDTGPVAVLVGASAILLVGQTLVRE